MTHNTDEITPEQQLEWYREAYQPLNEQREIYGYVMRKALEPIGYGLVTHRHDAHWVSGGLVGEARGSGLGEALFDFLTRKIHEGIGDDKAFLDVRPNNEPARRLYEKLGYTAIGVNDGLIVMVHRQTQEAS
jgi:ribosomal-protein-alanine N-acetyltransferase